MPTLDKHTLSAPILNTHHANDLELAMKAVFCELVGALLVEKVGQIHHYGTPFLGDPTTLESFIKLHGVGVVSGTKDEKLLQLILREWISLASERGVAFLTFLLDMLYPNQYQMVRLYHSLSKAHHYPKAIYENDGPDRFLTSRLRIQVSQDIDLRQLSSLAPTIKRLVPAHIVAMIAVNMVFEKQRLAAAVAMNGVYYFDARPQAGTIRHNRTIRHDGSHNYYGRAVK